MKKQKQISLLEAARIDAVCRRVHWAGRLLLDADTYRMLRNAGLSRTDVARAVEAMVADHEIIIDTSRGSVCVKVISDGGTA